MARVINKLLNSHITFISITIIATSFIALLFTNTENFFTQSSSSVISPNFDFNVRVDNLAKLNFNKTKSKNVVADELLVELAKEHIPIIMCGFYDLVTGPKRLQRPSNIDEGRWLNQVWSELMEEMGIPAELYMSIMQLRYSWFTETRDSFETFQSKLEVNFIKATLERYIKSKGNFVPTSVDKYNKALQCKMYRVFSKTANLTHYMSSSSNTTQTTTNKQPTTSNTNTTQTTTNKQPTTSNTNTTQTTTNKQPTTTSPSTTAPANTTSTTPTSPSTTTPANTTSTTPTTPTTPTTTNDTKKEAEKPQLKWNVPANFTAMCLEKGNRFQCFLMSILVVIAIVCIIGLIIAVVSGQQQQQPQSQF